MISHPEANPESIAAILHLCKLQEFPKVAALATKLKNIYRPIWLLPYQKNNTLLTATRFTMEQIGVATGLVTTKLYGTSTCGCNNDTIFKKKRAILTFLTVDIGRAR